MIVAEQLTKRFGRLTAVDAVDFAIESGDVVGFLGPNGAGKTTTIRMLTGYLRPSSGRVSIGGLDVHQHSLQVRRMLGYLPEQAPVYPEMRVSEYLSYRSKLYQVPRRQRKSAIERALSRCWLEEVRRRPVGQLSKGYRQRVGLAAALLHEPKVLVLDEPTVGLDPAQIRQVRRLITELAGDHTIILSTHILPEVEMTCRSYMMIAGGCVRAEGKVANLGSTGSATYIIETRGATVAAALAADKDIERILTTDLSDGWIRLTVTARKGAGDLRERFAERIGELKAPLRELRCDQRSLESVFMEVLQQAEGASVSSSSSSGPGNDAEPKLRVGTSAALEQKSTRDAEPAASARSEGSS